MRLFARIAALSALALASVGVASATPINLASYATTASTPAGVGNTATTFGVLGSTYDIGTGGVWANPVGSSSWVSFNANTYPGGSFVAPNGLYTYYSEFLDYTPDMSFGSLTVLADDTVSVFLNGNLVVGAAAAVPATHCTVATPNCMTASTYALTSSQFSYGVNVLKFVVNQDFNAATGLDFAGSISTTPEPSSLILLGSGLMGSAGSLYRRFRKSSKA